jgi:multiple sugar transport system substrate-binding protein
MNKKMERPHFTKWCTNVKHLGLASVGICLLLVFLTSCTEAIIPPEPVTISFAYPEWYDTHFETLVDEFQESHPHITLELRPVPGSVFVQTFWAGDADSFVGGTWLINLRTMLEQGLIMDLRPFTEDDVSFDLQDYYLGEGALLTEGSAIRGLPLGTDMVVMYYNQDLFDQHGIAYPQVGWTWADFLEAGLTLTDPDADVFGYVPTNSTDATSFVYQHGGQLFDDLRSPTYATFDDPLTIEALEWYAALFFEHNIAPTPDQARQAFGRKYTDENAYLAILGGQTGMWAGPFWQQGSWEDENSPQLFRWGMAPLPSDAQAATPSTGDFLYIFEDAQNPEACWEWLSFVSEQMPPEWLVPMRKSQVESDAFTQLVGSEAAAVVRASTNDLLIISPATADRLNIFRQAVERIIYERSTPSEALEWAQLKVDQTFR